jgi:hypothetical protein
MHGNEYTIRRNQSDLWASIEDYFGLWEVVWELKSEPLNVPDDECLETAQRIVRRLLRQRWDALCALDSHA